MANKDSLDVSHYCYVTVLLEWTLFKMYVLEPRVHVQFDDPGFFRVSPNSSEYIEPRKNQSDQVRDRLFTRRRLTSKQ